MYIDNKHFCLFVVLVWHTSPPYLNQRDPTLRTRYTPVAQRWKDKTCTKRQQVLCFKEGRDDVEIIHVKNVIICCVKNDLVINRYIYYIFSF